MTNLNWFQARDLAQGERRAIRRTGWQKWLLYRFRLWLLSSTDAATGLETRRVATTEDFRDSEFLAKDWTDEAWAGGSYPPCTAPGPVLAPAASVTGGTGAWTRAAALCSGAGQGGGVVPPYDPSPGTVAITASLSAAASSNGAPFEAGVSSTAVIRIDWTVPPGFGPVVDGLAGQMRFWLSPTGIDLSTAPVTAGDPIAGADGPLEQGVGPSPYDWSHWILFPVGVTDGGSPYPYTPIGSGPQHFTARLVLLAADHVTILAHQDLSLDL